MLLHTDKVVKVEVNEVILHIDKVVKAEVDEVILHTDPEWQHRQVVSSHAEVPRSIPV